MPSRDAPTPGPQPSGEIARHEATPALADAFDRAWRHAGGDRLAREALQGILALFFDLDAWSPWLGEARALLDTDELGRVGRKRRARDGDELALGYGLHRLVLGRVLGRAARDVPLGRDRLGRPCLRGDEWQTSLSHAGGAVAVAVSGRGVVGVDLEAAARAAQMEEIAGRVLHPGEHAAVAGLPEPARARELLALWVRKEALLKAAGIGLAREMDSFRAPDGEPVALPAMDGPDGAGAVVRMLDAGPGWVAAVAGLPGLRAVANWLPPPRD
ncbi:MAG TPA: 4'-phosphopantetheinyl transferase superfamily protein [Luteimonas sp.]|nr:4'-phosphopantetheinyl transferase superfamily protein [Luteimonas sp.]